MDGFRVIIHRKAVKELKSLPEAFREMESSPFAGDVRKIKRE